MVEIELNDFYERWMWKLKQMGDDGDLPLEQAEKLRLYVLMIGIANAVGQPPLAMQITQLLTEENSEIGVMYSTDAMAFGLVQLVEAVTSEDSET